MGALSRSSLSRRALVALVTVFIAVFGVLSAGQLKRELIPSLELPVISVLLTGLGLIKAEWLVKGRKVMIVIIFVVAAIITPPDVVSQIMVAVPMIGLYELSILLSRLIGNRRKEKEDEEEDTDEDEAS